MSKVLYVNHFTNEKVNSTEKINNIFKQDSESSFRALTTMLLNNNSPSLKTMEKCL